MNFKFLYAFALCFLIVSCGAKKNTQKTHAPKRQRSSTKEEKSTSVKRKLYKTADDPHPLPKDNGIFMAYTISSTEDYIITFADIAKKEMRAYGIPASITLAQGILESNSGRSNLTIRSNNHFGIKCHSGWLGPVVFHDDDAKGECFRKYNNPMFSFRDHSIFLANRGRYSFLFNYRKDNYKGWAKGLKEAGYATDRKYPDKLISIIKRYELYKYDREVLREGYVVKKKVEKPFYITHKVTKGETLYSISKKYSISVAAIKNLNSLKSNDISIGQELIVRKDSGK